MPESSARAILCGGDAVMRDVLRFLLRNEGVAVTDAATIIEIRSLVAHTPDALVALVDPPGTLDWIVDLLRQAGHRGPLLLLTHAVTSDLRRRAFALGIIDVIGLPATSTEILARLRAVTGSMAEETARSPQPLQAGGLSLHATGLVVQDETGRSVQLTPTEAAVLGALMRQPGRPIARQDLLDRVRGTRDIGRATLDIRVQRLRRKLPAPDATAPRGYVRTVRGQGYVFDARTGPRPALSVVQSGPPTVLIVDDDRAIVDMISGALHDAGYRAAVATGRDAVIAARRLQPAVILLDLVMPEMDGITIQRLLHAQPLTAAIPIIGLSSARTLHAHAAELDVVDYLAKPFDLDQLLLRVEKWAGRAGGEAAPDRPVSS